MFKYLKKPPTIQFKKYEQEFKQSLFQKNENSHTKYFAHSECNCSNSVFVLMETTCEWTWAEIVGLAPGYHAIYHCEW